MEKLIKPQNEKPLRRLLNVEEAAAYLSLSPRTLYNGISRKSKKPFPVKPKRWGKRVLFDIEDLNRFADQLPKDGTPDQTPAAHQRSKQL